MTTRAVQIETPVEAIITDIEGTTTTIAFVHEVLFPYARKHLRGFVAAHGHEPEVHGLLDAAKREAGDPAMTDEAAIAALLRWIDEDRKATPLKGLQGMIWAEGFRAGAFQSHVYEDANEALRRWHAAGKKLYVYSSGSVTAQKLLFRYTPLGDLTPLFSGFFDTTAGHKLEAGSYRHIAKTIGIPPARILFLTDAIKEIEAARAAGLQTVQLRRPGEAQAKGDGPEAASFAEIVIV
jgi:enolase-phosphatase E1